MPPTPILRNRLVALQHREFRLLWWSILATNVGLQMQTIAVNWHVYTLLREDASVLVLWGYTLQLTAGALALGGLGLMRYLPLLLFGVVGGILADAANRRKLLLITLALGMVCALLPALLTFGGVIDVLMLYGVVAALTALWALETPAREALVANAVPRDRLTNAVSLVMLVSVVGGMVGPALAGVVLETGRIGVVYLLHALTYLPALIAVARLEDHGPPAGRPARLTRAALLDGFRFSFSTPIIRSTMLLDFFATLVGSARTLLPIVADQVLGIGAGGYGLLATAQPLGSVLAGGLASWRREIRCQGALFLLCVAAYGLATALFGVSTVFALSYALFAVSGAADTLSSIVRGAVRQLWTPDELRGRMVGVNMLFYMGGPQLGEVRAGMVAALVGAPWAIISGGLAAALLASWAAWRDRTLREYTADVGYAAVRRSE